MRADYSVILVPEDGDPLELLRLGPCRFSPPRMFRITANSGAIMWGNIGPNDAEATALVLGYQGALLDVGVRIAVRAGAVVPGWRAILREWMAGDFRDPVLALGAEALVIDERGHIVERSAP